MSAPSFRTKTGACHIYEDRLVLTRTGPRGQLADRMVSAPTRRAAPGRSPRRILGLYLALAGYCAWVGVRTLRMPGGARTVLGGAILLLAAWLLYNVVRSRDLTADMEIPVADIREITAHPARRPATRPYLTVHYGAPGGRAVRRLILLPGLAQGGGPDDLSIAMGMLRQAGLPVRSAV